MYLHYHEQVLLIFRILGSYDEIIKKEVMEFQSL